MYQKAFASFRRARAFTLIELLVVIAIIGMLAAVVLASLNSARIKAQTGAGLALAANLLHAYGAESVGVWNLDEGTGLVATSKVGQAPVNGAITSASWTSPGPNGGPALAFTSGSKVTLGVMTMPVAVTVAAWIQTNSAAQQPIFSNRGDGLYFGTSGGKFFVFYNTASPASMYSNKSINDNKWHHVVWTSDGSKSRMYVDGNLDSAISQTRGVSAAATAYIGFDAGNGEYFSGNISQLAVYTQVLSIGSVARYFAVGPMRLQ